MNLYNRFMRLLLRDVYRRIELMSTKQEVLDAIAAEKAEVAAAIKAVADPLQAQIDALKEQLANGTGITAADLDEIKSAVQGIVDVATPQVAKVG